MGMYDNVVWDHPCPECGSSRVSNQSKAGLCILDTVYPCEVSWFMSRCADCGTHIEYKADRDYESMERMILRVLSNSTDEDSALIRKIMQRRIDRSDKYKE